MLRRCGDDAEMRTAPDLLELTERIEAQLGRRSRVGLGGVARSADAIAASYAEARIALRVGPRPAAHRRTTSATFEWTS